MKSKPHLFPHSYLPEESIRKLILFLGPLRIYHPWFVNPPDFFRGLGLELMNPAEESKPKGDFKLILSGCRAWAEQNFDRSRKEILKLRGAGPDEGAIWDIRGLLKDGAQTVNGKGEDLSLKRHLVLHLADEIERNHFDAVNMMDFLNKKGSVLAGVLQEPGEGRGLFAGAGDLAGVDIPDNLNIGLILDAWFGLFSGYLKENDLLATCNRHVIAYLSSQWENKAGEAARGIALRLPGVVSQEDIIKIRGLILGCGEAPGHCMDELFLAAKGVEGAFSSGSTGEIFEFNIRYFPLLPEGRSFEKKDILGYIAGKTIISVSSSQGPGMSSRISADQ